VAGAGSDWASLTALAERLSAPVWQEPFGSRAGFPQDHPLFAGHLPADRPRLRAALSAFDAVLAVGAPIIRQYPYTPGPLMEPGTRLAIVTADPAEAHRSPAELAVLGDVAAVCGEVAALVSERPRRSLSRLPVAPLPPAEPLRDAHVLAALGERLPRDVALIEEAPSSRMELCERIPARTPFGFISAAMGGLGFAVPAAIGLRMARPDLPVVAIVGDGSSLYAIQALWSAARYGSGALIVVLANGRYAIMDRLAGATGRPGPWPAFEDVDVSAIARGLGCPAQRVETHDELIATLDELVPGLAERTEPLVLEVTIVA
jgi:benzoylformate decarboxylase